MEVITELFTELKVRVKTQQPKELGVFNSPRLFIVVTMEILAEIAAEISAEVINRTELKARVKIQQPKKLTEVANRLGYYLQI